MFADGHDEVFIQFGRMRCRYRVLSGQVRAVPVRGSWVDVHSTDFVSLYIEVWRRVARSFGPDMVVGSGCVVQAVLPIDDCVIILIKHLTGTCRSAPHRDRRHQHDLGTHVAHATSCHPPRPFPIRQPFHLPDPPHWPLPDLTGWSSSLP